MIVWGTRLYGKVDQVADLCWVATRFLHIYFVPLAPLGSYVVLAENEEDGLPIPLSWKSVVAAYGAAVSVCLVLAGMFAVLAGLLGRRGADMIAVMGGVGLLVAGLAGTVAVHAYPTIRRASYERARELCDMLDITSEGRAHIDLAYGQITEAEALQRIEAAREEARKQREATGQGPYLTLAEAAETKRARRRRTESGGDA